MKSSVDKLRILFLLLIFSVIHICSSAYASDYYNDVLNNLLNKTSVTKHAGISVPDSAGSKAPLAISLMVGAYQSRIALLNWSDPGLPGTFVVERYALSCGWVDIATLPSSTLTYNDTITSPYCNPVNFTYRIRFESLSGTDDAVSPDMPAPSPLSDKNPPDDVKSLNVDLTFHSNVFSPRITWNNITLDSISHYEIERYDGFSWPSVGSVSADSNGFYDKTAPNACLNPLRYMVFTHDRCGNTSGQQVVDDLAVQTIKLEVAFPDQCDKSVELNWNPYVHMSGGLGGYKVFRSDVSTTVELPETQNTTYVDNFDFKSGQVYFYTVKAVSSDGLISSSSCEVVAMYAGAIPPDTVIITQVSVEDDSYIRAGYHLSPAGSVVKLILERSDDGGSTFHAIDSLPLIINGAVPADYFFIDSTADVHGQSYYYRLIAFDDCGFPTLSKISRSIFLDCSSSETQNSLEWNKYEYWEKGVKGYDVYRILNRETASITAIGNLGPDAVSFPDALSNYDTSKEACYWVTATETPGNFLNNPVSLSNTCCVIREPVIFIPNAFRPDGENKYFRPVPKPLYIESQTFKMTIFNRWGQQLFETTSIENGWDGNVNGQASPAGLYSYFITFKSAMGEEFTKRGTVMLVR